MVWQHARLGEGVKPIDKTRPLTHQNLLQDLLALSRRGRGHNNARRARCTPRGAETSFRQVTGIDQRVNVGALLLEAGLDLKRLHLLERRDIDAQ